MIKHAVALVLALAPLTALQAETVIIPVGQQAADKQSLNKPRRGKSTDQVLEEFGSPASRRGPVGDPPISVWEYPQFSVYFEHDRVLHTVVKRETITE